MGIKINKREISQAMGQIVFEAAMLSETGAIQQHDYYIPLSVFRKKRISVRVEAYQGQDNWTYYDVELYIGRRKSKQTFNDTPPAIKFLTAEIAEAYKDNGHEVV